MESTWPIGPIFLIWVSLATEVVEAEPLLHHALGDPLGLIGVDVLLDALDEGEDVAHAEDALGKAVRVERLEAIGTLAGADECDRQPGDAPDAEGGASARVAVHLP